MQDFDILVLLLMLQLYSLGYKLCCTHAHAYACITSEDQA